MTKGIDGNFGVKNYGFNEIEPQESEKKNDGTIFNNKQEEGQVITDRASENKPPKLDYTSFSKKFRAFANELATRSQNEVKDLARDFNKNYPATPYVIDYSEFPKPEDFSAKNLGGKEAAYHAWSSAVKEWVEDCKQDMQSMKDTGMKDLSDQIARGFLQSWINQGITREVILNTLAKHDNDMKAANEELKSIVQKEHAKTRGTVRAEASATRGVVRDEGNWTRIDGHITRGTIAAEGEKTRDEIEAQAVKTRQNIEENKQEEAKKSELREKINLALRNEPVRTKAAIKTILGTEGKKFNYRGNNGNNIADIVENMDLDTLQRIVDALTVSSTPWGR